MTDASKAPTEAPDLGALSGLAPQLARTFVSIASDIALVIDTGGVILDVAVGADPITGSTGDWVGRRWAETVTGDTRLKIEQLLTEVRASGVTRRREVNLMSAGGQDIPVAYSAIRLGRDGPVLAVGRDLRAVAAIQQRFIDAQQEMERNYWRQRQAESRYRLLFQVATDAVMVVDAKTLLIVEANRAAGVLFDCPSESLVGQSPAVGVARAARPGVEELLATARSTGRPAEIRALMPQGRAAALPAAAIDLSATPFRADDTMLLLVRARSVASAVQPASGGGGRLNDFVERTPDAVAITDSAGRVLMANPAFEALCPPEQQGQVLGRSLTDVLGDPQRTLAAILAEARRLGIAEQKNAAIGRGPGGSLDVEVSAALLAEGDQECIGLTLRRTETRPERLCAPADELAGLIDRLAAQIGLVGLGDLTRQAGDLVERHLMQVALSRCQGHAHRAAQLLGIDVEILNSRMRLLGVEDDSVVPGHSGTLLN